MDEMNQEEKAAIMAMKKHHEIINHLKDIITLNNNRVSYRNEYDQEMTDLMTLDFILLNVEKRVDYIKALHKDIEKCYEQMGVFNKKNN